jgi:Calcineurin-like phosphoesterase
MKKTAWVTAALCLVAADWRIAGRQTPDWGNGVAPFAFALIGDMPCGGAREAAFGRLVGEINRDNDVDFVMHAGDIKAGSERCDNELIVHRFTLYQAFRRAFVFTPGDNEWTDCHRVNNGQYNPIERLAFLRSVFFPQVGETTGGQIRPVQSQAETRQYSEFVENVMFRRQGVMFATVHVVGSNNGLEPWSGLTTPDSCTSPRADRLAEFERRQAAALAWIDEVFAAAGDTKGLFLLIQANPYNLPSNPALCPSGFQDFLACLETRAKQIRQAGRARARRRSFLPRRSAVSEPARVAVPDLRRGAGALGEGSRRPKVERGIQDRAEDREVESRLAAG